MTVVRWHEAPREQLTSLLPIALVIVPVGAVEQHGPHLPTGTDSLVAQDVVDRATALADAEAVRPLVVAPPVWIGVSDHHIEFGGTLSFSPETMIAVLLDIARSVAEAGGLRLVFVNGHGGNRGPCATAAAIASTRHELAAAYADYWELAESDDPAVPGHAGRFESSLVQAIRPDLVGDLPVRPVPPDVPLVPGFNLYSSAIWRAIDGYTDDPSRASRGQGKAWLDACVSALAKRLVELASAL